MTISKYPNIPNQFAIYHKPTGKYMPAKMSRLASCGWSWWDPLSKTGYEGINPSSPRLFTTKIGAKLAASAWLRGTHFIPQNSYGVNFSPPEIPRNKEEIEIHEIVLTPIRVK